MPARTPARRSAGSAGSSARGANVVSPQGRARTIAAFGEPLTPQQVVERICADVQCRGLDAVLDYTGRLDGVALDPATVRVSPEELLEPPSARPTRPTSARSAGSATTSWRSRSGILHRDATIRSAARAASCGSGIGRSGGSASASRAGRRRIPRRC